MKYRTDFVTNSSSSSFVIAIKNNVTVEQVKEMLLRDGKLEDFYKENEKWLDLPDKIKESETLEERIDLLAENLANEFFICYDSLTLDEWEIHAVTAGNEDGYPLGVFIYDGEGQNIDTDFMKVKENKQ